TETRKGHIFVVDSDPQTRGIIPMTLEANGYDVEATTSVEVALERCSTTKFDLILLNVSLPGISVLRSCKKLREITNAPLIIQAESDAIEDKIHALDAGADGYVTKTSAMGELLARIRAALRRSTMAGRWIMPLKLGEVEINFESRRVHVGGGRSVRLTPKEFDLLLSLASKPNQTVPYRELFREVWGMDHVNERRSLRVFINRLRQKIEHSPREPKFLVTEPFFGYRLQIPG
ncbi:MAG TPA: response regulator transcription factor, partial [Candidatus Acidoferrales bacterium]|nr:response regulator transcription factor [Candidatus Acidoferrales bacterium]